MASWLGRRLWGRVPAWWLATAMAIILAAGTALVFGTTGGKPGPRVLGERFTASGQGSTPLAAPLPAAGHGNGGGGNGNGGPGGGNNGNSGGPNPGHSIVLDGSVSGDLAPGAPLTLSVHVSNPNNQDIRVTDVSVTVGTPTKTDDTTGETTTVPTCDTTWVSVEHYSKPAATGQLVPKHTTRDVALDIELTDEPVNQDACKGVMFPLSFSATAVQA